MEILGILLALVMSVPFWFLAIFAVLSCLEFFVLKITHDTFDANATTRWARRIILVSLVLPAVVSGSVWTIGFFVGLAGRLGA